MNKFKTGDIVFYKFKNFEVKITLESNYDSNRLGLWNVKDVIYLSEVINEEFIGGFPEEYMILWEIYNSPLYQVLKET